MASSYKYLLFSLPLVLSPRDCCSSTTAENSHSMYLRLVFIICSLNIIVLSKMLNAFWWWFSVKFHPTKSSSLQHSMSMVNLKVEIKKNYKFFRVSSEWKYLIYHLQRSTESADVVYFTIKRAQLNEWKKNIVNLFFQASLGFITLP